MAFKSVFQTALTDVWTSAEAGAIGDKPGDLRWERDSDGMKCYKCIEYRDGDVTTAGVAGEACIYFTADGYKTSLVTSDYSAGEPAGNRQGAGILQAIITDTDRGWIQIKGFATMTINLGGTPADGDGLTCEAAGSADGSMAHALSDVSAASLFRIEAIACDESDDEIVCDFPF